MRNALRCTQYAHALQVSEAGRRRGGLSTLHVAACGSENAFICVGCRLQSLSHERPRRNLPGECVRFTASCTPKRIGSYRPNHVIRHRCFAPSPDVGLLPTSRPSSWLSASGRTREPRRPARMDWTVGGVPSRSNAPHQSTLCDDRGKVMSPQTSSQCTRLTKQTIACAASSGQAELAELDDDAPTRASGREPPVGFRRLFRRQHIGHPQGERTVLRLLAKPV